MRRVAVVNIFSKYQEPAEPNGSGSGFCLLRSTILGELGKKALRGGRLLHLTGQDLFAGDILAIQAFVDIRVLPERSAL
jgi:hypothetical protein